MLTPFEGQEVSVQKWAAMVTTSTPDRCTAGTCWRRGHGGINTGGRTLKQVPLTRCFDYHRISVLVRK